MGREIVGLKIGTSKLAAARVDVNGSRRLLQIATRPLPSGVVSGGEVRDVEQLSHELRELFTINKLSRRAVRAGVSTNRVAVRTIELGGIHDPKQLGNAVRFRAQEALPIPLSEAVLDYQVLSEGVDDEGQKVYRVQFAVAYRDLVDGYATACANAGIRLVGIDLEAFALLRALTPLSPPPAGGEQSALVAISIGAERSTLAVTNGTVCEFTRVLDWGGNALTAAIVQELQIEPEQAEQLKRAMSLNPDAPISAGLDIKQVETAREVVGTVLQGLARDLVSSLQFYQSQPGSLGFREIVLAGGTSMFDGLAETLTRAIAVAVRVGDPLVNLRGGNKIRGAEPDPSHAIAIGLGMGI